MVHTGYRDTSRQVEDLLAKGSMILPLIDELELGQPFAASYGFSHVQFQTAVMALLLHFRSEGSEFVAATQVAPINYRYLFGLVRAPKVLGAFILDTMSLNLGGSELQTLSSGPPQGVITDKPLGRYGDSLICLDFDGLEAKAARSLFNLVAGFAERSGAPGFRAEAGLLFDKYCQSMLAVAEGARSSAWNAPQSLLKSAPADALFVDKSQAVIFEFKSMTLPTTVKFGTDPAALAAAIESKFVFGERGSGGKEVPSGFIQCRNHLRTMLNRSSEFHLDLVKGITPCLVVLEDAMTWSPCYNYAIQKARSLFDEFGGQVGEPAIIHAEDLSALIARSKAWSLPAMIEAMAAQGLSGSFSTKNVIMKSWPEERLDATRKRVGGERPTAFFDDALRYLDPDTDGPANACDRCGAPSKLVPLRGGAMGWWCGNCKLSRAANPADVAKSERHRLAAIQWYERS